MKIYYAILCLFFFNLGISQTLIPDNATISFPPTSNNQNPISIPESTICGIDTNGYALAKATGLAGISINNATSAFEASQYFDAPQAITISGVTFYAYKPNLTNGSTMNVTVSVYNAGLDSIPTGLPLASAIVSVDTTYFPGTLDVLKKSVNFIPVTTSNPYVIVISNNTPTPMSLIFNNYNSQDGAQEWLSSVNIFSTWTRSYAVNVGGSVFDADGLIEPHTSYTLISDYVISDSCFTSGNTINFTNSSSPIIANKMYNQAAFLGITNVSRSWDFGDATPVVNAFDTMHTYSAPGVYSITLSDTVYGWKTNCFDSKTVVTGIAPTAAWTSTQSGLGSNFTNTTTTNPSNSYLWDFGDGNTSTMENPIHTYSGPGTYTVCLTVTNACGPNTLCNAVTVSCAAPTPAYSATVLGIGPDVNFTNSSTVGTGVTYLWDFGDGNTSTLANPNHTYSAAGTYTVCLTATDICGTDSTCQFITVDLCGNPIANFGVTGLPPSFTFTSNSTTNGSNVSYAWDFGDGNTANTQNTSHTYLTNGTFTVTLTVIDSCGTNTVSQVVTATGVGIDELDPSIVKIFPNPVSANLSIESSKAIETIVIIDLTGKTVYSSDSTMSKQQVDVSAYAKGQYILSIHFKDGQKQKTMIEVVH